MDEILTALASEWSADMAALRADKTAAKLAFQDIIRRHSERHRRYHRINHLAGLFSLMRFHAPKLRAGASSRLAVWWHDAIYDPRTSDNEERSADLARTTLTSLNAPPALIADVVRLILMTRNHWAAGSAGEGDLFLDCDIAILGAPAGLYDFYAIGIRQEYIFAPDDFYRAGRSRFLKSALERDRYFRTDEFESAYGAQTRENLKRELSAIGSMALRLTPAPESEPVN